MASTSAITIPRAPPPLWRTSPVLFQQHNSNFLGDTAYAKKSYCFGGTEGVKESCIEYRCMAVSLAPHNIRVNAIGPGSIMTEVLQAVANNKKDMEK